MRKLIVSNFLTMDGYYESAGKTFDRFFDYWHEESVQELAQGAGVPRWSRTTATASRWVSPEPAENA
jgi:hypothetical protein